MGGSELAFGAGVEDDLGDQVRGQAQLGGYLVWFEALLVIEEGQPLLRFGPWLAPWPGGLGRGPGSPGRALRRGRGRAGAAEEAAPLIAVLAAGEVISGLLVEDHVLLGRLVHADRHHGQALGVLLLAFGRHAVVVLRRSFGMQLGAARYAVVHSFDITLRARLMFLILGSTVRSLRHGSADCA